MQVWYITGGSGGLGLSLAKYLLEKGDRVAVTSRKLSNLERVLGKENENFLPLELNFNSSMHQDIALNFQAIESKFGRLDNLVNNAGYGLLGHMEEIEEKDLREQFEVNLFAPFLVSQAALKIMRPQSIKEGGNAQNIKARIFNLSSIAGFRSAGASTPYSMTKFALSAFSEGLREDVIDFGISVTNVMPAGFRTEFLGSSMQLGMKQISDYEAKRKVLLGWVQQYNGLQPGNPESFAKVIFDLSRDSNPPLNLFMGDYAYEAAKAKIEQVKDDIARTEPFAGKAVDFND